MDDRLQLEHVADEYHLLATEGFSHLATEDTQHLVDEIDDVAAHHRHFVDDDELHLVDELAHVTVVAQRLEDLAMAQTIVGIVGQNQMERQVEETVKGGSPHVDGGNTCGSEHNVFLARVLTYIFDEGRLSRPGFPGKEEALVAEAHEVQGILKFLIVGIGCECFCHRLQRYR